MPCLAKTNVFFIDLLIIQFDKASDFFFPFIQFITTPNINCIISKSDYETTDCSGCLLAMSPYLCFTCNMDSSFITLCPLGHFPVFLMSTFQNQLFSKKY